MLNNNHSLESFIIQKSFSELKFYLITLSLMYTITGSPELENVEGHLCHANNH